MPDVETRKSPIVGIGVFAARDFERDETLLVLDTSLVVDEARPLRPDLGEREDHLAYLAGGSAVLLPEPERRLNHSCNPNAFIETADRELRLVVRRRIERGQEITLDYLVNTHGGSSWRCACGSERCRGVLETSFFELPPDFQREYLPLLERWFVEEHREKIEGLGGA
ncbi:MAG: SET domain-containing protein-lysine N-methyltransferase [Gemmatimonadota bacterium]|nr:SET domain-containing protein-lysine N-methyltransferase [Gemmatimonadota bacterium]